jgi:hypothetical protein
VVLDPLVFKINNLLLWVRWGTYDTSMIHQAGSWPLRIVILVAACESLLSLLHRYTCYCSFSSAHAMYIVSLCLCKLHRDHIVRDYK